MARQVEEAAERLRQAMQLRSCVCTRALHNYLVMPGDDLRSPRLLPKACCRCPEDCLCH